MPTTKALSASKFFGKDRYEYYLNELLTQQKVGGNALSKSQIKEGFLKRKDKISFEKFVEKVISTKTIVAPTKKSTSSGGGLVKSPTGALEKYVSGVSKPQKMSGIEDDISKITKSVISIAEILSGQKKLKDSSTSYDRRKAEQEKRSLAESKLEKRFDGLKKAAEKILAPVKSLLDKIINFLVTVFLGRVVYKLLEWFGDPKNAGKVRAISRFLGDHWPKLLALYLTFGTSVGRFALRLTKIVAKGAIKLLAKILLLSKAKKLRAAGRFFGGKGGKIAGAVLGTAAVVGGAYALTQGMKGDDEEPKTLKPEEPKTPGYAGGGIIKIPAFKGGGFNFKGMFGGALGSSPEKPEEMPNGFVSGEKGVDKVPAMLSDGEFVMSVGAVQKYGVDTLEGMNAAGGGTNKPKMMGGKTYAEGGGMVGNIPLDPKVGTDPSDNQFRRHARTLSQNGRFGTEEDLFKAFKKLGGVPDFQKMVGGSDNFLKINQGLYGDDALDTIRKSVVEKLKGVNNPQSFGGGKVGNIPEGMLDPDQPWYKNPRPKTWEILKAKLTGGTHNGTTYQSSVNLSNTDADKLIENLKKDPRGYPQVNVNDKYGGMENLRKYQAWLKETYLSQSKPTPQPQSFTESSRKSAGLDDLGKQYDLDRKTNPMRGYADDLPKLNTPKPIQPSASVKPNIKPIQPNASVKPNIKPIQPSASVKPNIKPIQPNASVKPDLVKNIRAPIPASRAIVPYTGGGALARQGGGALATNPLQQIGTNMNVSPGRAAGFIKGAKTLGVELLLQYFLDKGMNYLDAKRISGIVDKASKEPAEKRDAYIESVRKDLDKEKRHQKSLGGIFDKIIKMGGETGSERMSRNQESLLAALGSKSYQGGAIKGGFGLKDQSFKDMPKTQIMSDDKGRPFVGYKSMRGGKPVYVRGPQPGEGTSNPLEMMGRMINPGAYKDVDALSEQKKYQQASAGSISSLKARGASQLTLANRQSQLKKSIPAVPSRSASKIVSVPSVAGGGMAGRRGSGTSGSQSAGSQTPSFSARNPSGGRSKQETLGLMR